MPVSRPYYNLHQILLGQYSNGNEYVFDDGTDYVGPFHVLPNGQKFTGPRPELRSVQIFEKRNDIDENVLRYNLNTGNRSSRYETPVSISRRPDSNEFSVGKMERYFVQKRTNPYNTIIEIDSIQFNKINTKNNPGINGNIWNALLLIWIISKIPSNDAYILNRMEVQRNQETFPGIEKYLIDYLEFYQ